MEKKSQSIFFSNEFLLLLFFNDKRFRETLGSTVIVVDPETMNDPTIRQWAGK